jgi:peptidoglycan lytic transglycosylase
MSRARECYRRSIARLRPACCVPLLKGCGVVLAVVILYGCGSTSGRPQPRADNAPPPSVRGYKVGNPYRVKGVWYYPRIDYDYAEVGVASWYGPGFHGRSTANGEAYDMNDLTAAHRTLPMPSIVRVTNLENGRSIKLRVNDRGPFVGDRIIDVSRRAAQLLGFHLTGTAPVRVEIVADESMQLAAALGAPVDVAMAAPPTEQPVAEVASAYPPEQLPAEPQLPPESDVGQVAMAYAPVDALPATAEESYQEANASSLDTDSTPVTVPTDQPRSGSAIYVQAGAFADAGRAALARRRLSPIGPIVMTPSRVNGRDLLRVRVGPLRSDGEAERVLASVSRAGFPDCRLVAE